MSNKSVKNEKHGKSGTPIRGLVLFVIFCRTNFVLFFAKNGNYRGKNNKLLQASESMGKGLFFNNSYKGGIHHENQSKKLENVNHAGQVIDFKSNQPPTKNKKRGVMKEVGRHKPHFFFAFFPERCA
ncbi:hypothetical protein [Bacillus thermotolerans]|nr:hypothetical protein [Bacillus thermotolerans]